MDSPYGALDESEYANSRDCSDCGLLTTAANPNPNTGECEARCDAINVVGVSRFGTIEF